MTPYELRFQIFQQAQGLAEAQFHAEFEIIERWNENNTAKRIYPKFPSLNVVLEKANIINNFVSDTK